jgi:hypothetical protein
VLGRDLEICPVFSCGDIEELALPVWTVMSKAVNWFEEAFSDVDSVTNLEILHSDWASVFDLHDGCAGKAKVTGHSVARKRVGLSADKLTRIAFAKCQKDTRST